MSACPFVCIFGKIVLNAKQTYSNAEVACHDINLQKPLKKTVTNMYFSLTLTLLQVSVENISNSD